MTGLGSDIRGAFRGMARRPLVTVVCVGTLAVGIGATTAILSVVDAVVVRPLPYPESDRLVRVMEHQSGAPVGSGNVSGANFLDVRADSSSFEGVAGYVNCSFNVAGDDFPMRIKGAVVTPDFFQVLRVHAARGRVLSPAVDVPDGEPAVVVSDGFWRTHLGAAEDVIGRRVRLSGEERTVVGVMPTGFDMPAGTAVWASARYRVPDPPLNLGEDPAKVRGAQYFRAIARLGSERTLAAAQSEMDEIGSRLETEFPDSNQHEVFSVVPLKETIVSAARPTLALLLAGAGFVLLIAVVNTANLLLARGTERRSEIALRLAIGAHRARIARQFLTESLLLAAVGGVLGVLLATWGSETLLAVAPTDIPRAGEVAVNLRVLGFTALVVLGSGLLFGLAPAAHLSRSSLQAVMNEGRGATSSPSGRGLRRALVVLAVAVSLLLLVGTGLLMRTYLKLLAVDPGFDAGNALVAHVALPRPRYEDDAEAAEFHRRVLERLRALPGVESASTVLTLPMHHNIRGTLSFNIEGRPLPEGAEQAAGFQVVDPEYFRTLRIPLRAGRLLSDTDGADDPQVALVNEAFARQYWPDGDAIGHRITLGDTDEEDTQWATIVGVVGDTHLEGLDTVPEPEMYFPFRQSPMPYMTLVVRTSGDAAGLADTVRRVVAEIDPDQPVTGVATMDEVLADSLARRRFTMVLLGVFAAIGMLMAAVGLYGVMSFFVAQRTHEIGIRLALGARPGDVVRLVVNEGLRLVAAGLVIGALGALGLTRLIGALIHGVSAADPPSFVLAAALLVAAGLLASYVPARRAVRVEPMSVLRSE
jgi:putative ABC transport system permease protein